MDSFDGVKFSEFLIVIILVSLFFYGSTNIDDLTTAPTTT
ncbi:hypothetical protein J2Z32_003971 [Paenibacillus turicensis]|uniref:Uncharacterized protein n=1 Tax=Paenibacillus turicensis TaxID=160487 RepID=A0ABS4FXI4_9BACL|nr:hypothetical protein [Paenibacillus turicensis]